MINFSRSDNSIFGRWWWTVDRPLLFSFVVLIAFGILLAMAATPMVANRIGLEEFYFLKRHLCYVVPSLMIIFIISTFDEYKLKKFALILFFGALTLTFLTLIIGAEIKGARRWINLGGFSIQPSEFVKPALAILTAWMFANQKEDRQFKGIFVAICLLLLFAIPLVLQPDIGMLFVTTAVWGGQIFVFGLSIFIVIAAVLLAASGLGLAYIFLPHVTTRIDKFLNPAAGDHYQIDRSLEAFECGGLFGVGPGEGLVKRYLPDAHADFVFAVLGEEFGFFVCALVVCLIAFIVVYGMLGINKDKSIFSNLALLGLLIQFGLQSGINMASALHLMPTKGMTLPFMSYGGSSMLAISICAGMILALSKKKIVNYLT